MREDVILEGAYDLLTEKSYGEMSMDDVAARSGMSKATLYQLFASKQDLAVGVVTRCMKRHLTALETVDASLPPGRRLEVAMRMSLRERARFDTAKLGVPRPMLRHDPRYMAMLQRLEVAMTELIEAAKAAGELSAEIPTPAILAMFGALFSANYDFVTERSEAALPQITDALVSIVFRGLHASSVESQPR